jgi:signal transduction histidine kinase
LSEAGAEDRRVQVHFPVERAEQAKRLARRIVREPFQKRTWAELGFFLASSALACAVVLPLAVLGVTGLALTFVLIGIFVLAGGLRAARALGGWQRTLARWILGEEISAPDPVIARRGLVGWLRASLGDWAAWRAVGYFVVKVPFTVFGVWFALSVWLEALAGIASLLIGGTPPRFGFFARFLGPAYNSGAAPGFVTHVTTFAIGVVLLFVAPWATRLVVYLDKRMMHLLLSRDAASSRVKSLEESRSRTLDAANETLRRIERNLHDGTQAQLVALAMRLGQAKEKLDRLDAQGGDGEVEAIRRLVDEAHRGVKDAITDLRDLARGIHPPALDTGLENALATLASRSPVPTEVTVSIPARPSPAVEAICYFCAAELLANVAQHAHASRASLSCAQHGPWLRIVVRDNGRGGAGLNRLGSSSSGLAGLVERVAAVDGLLSIASPPGGPTTITVDVPSRS